MKRLVILGVICLMAFNAKAQTDWNQYKYVVVPMQFDFVKGKDKYRVNTLTRYLFKQKGFETLFDEQELPEDLFKNRCLAMYADVKRIRGGFFKTQLQIELKDCRGNVIIKSDVGRTKEKQYNIAYKIAIREAFKSFDILEYNYDASYELKEDDEVSEAKPKEVTETPEVEVVEEKAEEVSEVKKAVEDIETVVEDVKETAAEVKEEASEPQLLYAQPIENGYQLIDTEPKKVMILLNTAAKDVYSVKGKDAIVFKRDGQWIYSENTGTSKIEKVLQIKF